MERIPSRANPPALPVSYADGAGQTLDELKPEKAQLLPAEIAPLPSRQLMSLIGTLRSTDELRLNTPEAGNPFQSSPMGPKQDYLVLQKLIRRSKNPMSKDLAMQLDRPIEGISEQSQSFMQASLAREHNMLQLLNGLMNSIGQIHNRIVGSQEG